MKRRPSRSAHAVRASWLSLLVFLLAISGLASCTTPATQVIVQLDTDLPESRTVVVRVTASQFDVDGGSFGRPTNWTFTRGGPLGEHQLPGTFGVNPASDAARNARVQLQVAVYVAAASASEPSLFFRRTLRFQFTPHRTLNLGVFLSLHCGEPAIGCTSVSGSDCTVSTLCEERGLTCGDHAECISGDVTPTDPEAGFPDTGTVETGPMDATDIASDTGPATTCSSDMDCGSANARCDLSAHRCVECLATADCATSRSGSVCLVAEHRCVACAVSADCAGSTEGSVCNVTTGRCAACAASSDCAGAEAGHVCSFATGLCTACARDTDCVGHPNGALCDTASGRCVACTATTDRCGSTEHCDATSGTCVAGCHDDSGCLLASARHCDTTAHTCVACTTDAHCPPNTHCTGGMCATGCSDSTQCAPGQSCCGGTCADTLSSETSCGACGATCAPANAIAVCASGTCTIGECTAPFLDCNGSIGDGCEANRLTSPTNCGACGRTCMAGPNATAMCVSGVCSRACAAGFADCNGDPSDGCEVTLGSDANNCGACGRACTVSHGVGGCQAGACTIATCASGFMDCNTFVGDGCEADTTTDVANCGACGTVCTRAPGQGSATCGGGVCAGVCDMYRGDCDGNTANGCEADLGSSPTNCGMCGRACSFPHSSPQCLNASCAIASCTPGYGNCDGIVTNGCEVDLTSDVNSCGACGFACGTAANGTRSCRSSVCATTCAPRYGDCDSNSTNGCESGPIDSFPVAACTNIAPMATITASNPPLSPQFPLSNTVDGNLCTRGVIGNFFGSFTFDWGTTRSMRGVTFTPALEYDGTAGVNIHWVLNSSTDGTTFTARDSGDLGPNETHYVDFGSNQNYRALRWDFTLSVFPFGGLGEFVVHQCP